MQVSSKQREATGTKSSTPINIVRRESAVKPILFFLITLGMVACVPSTFMTLEFEFPPFNLPLAQDQSPRDAIIEVIKRLDKCLEPKKDKWVVSPDYENLALNVSVTIPDVDGSNRDRIIAITVDFLLNSIPSPPTTRIEVIPKVSQESVLYLRDQRVRVNDHGGATDGIKSLKEEVKKCLYPSSPV